MLTSPLQEVPQLALRPLQTLTRIARWCRRNPNPNRRQNLKCPSIMMCPHCPNQEPVAVTTATSPTTATRSCWTEVATRGARRSWRGWHTSRRAMPRRRQQRRRRRLTEGPSAAPWAVGFSPGSRSCPEEAAPQTRSRTCANRRPQLLPQPPQPRRPAGARPGARVRAARRSFPAAGPEAVEVVVAAWSEHGLLGWQPRLQTG
mmetsp:Transcript_103321/g.296667  ORF Transcript_103321/g.296667 Transcript_103321/m.296667 type:complete len:203 (+) Transcript_103321:1570-2178(+)